MIKTKYAIFALLFFLFLVDTTSADEIRGSVKSGNSESFSVMLDFIDSGINVGGRVLVVWEDDTGFPIDLGEAALVSAKGKILTFAWNDLYGAEPTSDMTVLLEPLDTSSNDVALSETAGIVARDAEKEKSVEPKKPSVKEAAPVKIEKQRRELVTDDAKQLAKSSDSQTELAFWGSVKDSDDPRMFEAYLSEYSEGSFVSLARIKLDKLNAEKKQKLLDAEQAGVADDKAEEKLSETSTNRGAVLFTSNWKALKDEKTMSAQQQLEYVQKHIVSTIANMKVELVVDGDNYAGNRFLELVLSRKQKAFGLTSKYYLYVGCTDSGGRKFWGEKERTLRGANLKATLDKLLSLTDKKLAQRSGLPCLGNQ